MHPAYSVIFFTTASGAGYGLLVWLALLAAAGNVAPNPFSGLVLFALALGLITAGLLSSTFHLGHPERAWRALSQWRSSWLSREGVAAIITYGPALLFALGWVIVGSISGLWMIAGLATGVMALVTIGCTGMIYASLRAIPRWTDVTVVPVYLAFGLATGGALMVTAYNLFTPVPPHGIWPVVLVIAVAWGLKLLYWRRIDNAKPVATAESATGLGHIGPITQFEAPHTGENYIMREMGYQIARKHAAKLRRIALFIGGAVPLIAYAVAALISGPGMMVACFLGLAGLGIGVLLERWLFFAEAKHAAMLYYGAKAV
jgi:DMSO reductase anchor subunit